MEDIAIKLEAQTNLSKFYDPVKNPSHYTEGREYEPVKVIEDWGLDYHLGNALKYISRAGRKSSFVSDLSKAIFYIERRLLIEEERRLSNEEEQSR
jgi:hypothetical protein|tara:strand:- start:124 stop:411 length:288 start_codon:yes stop_codon:yes gene_type:complete